MEKGKIVQIRVQDIDPNPNRKFSIYAIREDKVARLIESINKTGFWETVIGRYNSDPKKAGRVQIAFGHHRIAAALEVYKKPDDMIPIIIRDLSDDQMREMMIRENAEEFGCVPAAIDDAVQAARDYLEGHPEEVRKALTASGRPEPKQPRVGAPAIAEYTGYSENAVELSLQRLAAIASGEVDQEALYKMPHQQAALRFARAVLESRTKPNAEDQRKVADHLIKEGTFGKPSIDYAFREFLPAVKKNDPSYPGYYQHQFRKASDQIDALLKTLQNIEKKEYFKKDVPTMEDVSQLTLHSYNQSIYRLAEKIMDVAGLVDQDVPSPSDGREPSAGSKFRLELFLLRFFNEEVDKQYELTCSWNVEKRRPAITFTKRPWSEAEKEEVARQAQEEEAEKAKMEKLNREREQSMAAIHEKIARLKESAQKDQTNKETA